MSRKRTIKEIGFKCGCVMQAHWVPARRDDILCADHQAEMAKAIETARLQGAACRSIVENALLRALGRGDT